MTNRNSTAVVIGAGIFGVSTAIQLARRGVKVTLINDGAPGNGASGRSLSWLNSSRMRSREYHDLRMAGIDRYRTLAANLGNVDWLRFDGGLTWDADDAANGIDAAYRHEVSLAYDALHLQPAAVDATVDGIASETVTRQGAIFNPGEGWVDLPSLIRHLLAEFGELGGLLITDQGAAQVLIENGRAVGAVAASGQRFLADVVLLATGPSVPAMAAVDKVKIDDGTPVALLVQTKPLSHPLRAVLNTPRVAVRPAPGDTFSLDADWAANEVETLADGSYQVKESTITRLLEEASKILAGNPKLEVAGYGAGRKPIPGDGEPVLGEVQTIPGYFVAFSHSGATLGLVVGELLAYEMATGERHPMLARFRPERFSGN